MGCAHANSQILQCQPKLVRQNFHSDIGLLTIKIQKLNFTIKNSILQQSSYNQIKFQLLNQSFISFIHHNFGNRSNVKVEPSTFHLSINTFEKRRQLQVELFSQQELRCLKRIAFSDFDLISLIQGQHSAKISTLNSFYQNQKTINIKLLDAQGEQVSSLFLLTKFVTQQYEILTIKVNSITLRNYSKKKRKIYINIQVGQQTFESRLAVEDKSKIPTWSDALHTFIIPFSLKEGKISVFEKKNQRTNDLVGQLRLNLKTMLKDENLQSYCQQLRLNQQITGTIKLQILKSIQPNNVSKIKIDEPTKIAVDEKPFQGEEDFKIKINSIDSFGKTIHKKSTINFDSSRSRNYPSGKMKREDLQASKSINIYQRNHILLPPIQSEPLSGHQKDQSFLLQQNIEEENRINQLKQKYSILKSKHQNQQKKQFLDEKQEVREKGILDILRTQTNLVQKIFLKPASSEQCEFQESAELPPLNNFFIKLSKDIQRIDPHQVQQQNQISERGFSIQKKTRCFSRNSTRKLKQPIIDSNQKLITIDKDMEGRPLTLYTTQKESKPLIDLQSGFVQFNLTIKDESNQSKNSNPNDFSTIDIFNPNFHQINPPQKQNFNQKQVPIIKTIKQLGILTDEESFTNQKSNLFEFPTWQQEIYANPQISPQI